MDIYEALRDWYNSAAGSGSESASSSSSFPSYGAPARSGAQQSLAFPRASDWSFPDPGETQQRFGLRDTPASDKFLGSVHGLPRDVISMLERDNAESEVSTDHPVYRDLLQQLDRAREFSGAANVDANAGMTDPVELLSGLGGPRRAAQGAKWGVDALGGLGEVGAINLGKSKYPTALIHRAMEAPEELQDLLKAFSGGTRIEKAGSLITPNIPGTFQSHETGYLVNAPDATRTIRWATPQDAGSDYLAYPEHIIKSYTDYILGKRSEKDVRAHELMKKIKESGSFPEPVEDFLKSSVSKRINEIADQKGGRLTSSDVDTLNIMFNENNKEFSAFHTPELMDIARERALLNAEYKAASKFFQTIPDNSPTRLRPTINPFPMSNKKDPLGDLFYRAAEIQGDQRKGWLNHAEAAFRPRPDTMEGIRFPMDPGRHPDQQLLDALVKFQKELGINQYRWDPNVTGARQLEGFRNPWKGEWVDVVDPLGTPYKTPSWMMERGK